MGQSRGDAKDLLGSREEGAQLAQGRPGGDGPLHKGPCLSGNDTGEGGMPPGRAYVEMARGKRGGGEGKEASEGKGKGENVDEGDG